MEGWMLARIHPVENGLPLEYHQENPKYNCCKYLDLSMW